jgi:hypothetical protein
MKYTAIIKKPLTARMIEILMDCHEKEMMNLEPCTVFTLHNAKGLIDRGMLSSKPYITVKGKKIIAFYVTQLGRTYLSNL